LIIAKCFSHGVVRAISTSRFVWVIRLLARLESAKAVSRARASASSGLECPLQVTFKVFHFFSGKLSLFLFLNPQLPNVPQHLGGLQVGISLPELVHIGLHTIAL